MTTTHAASETIEAAPIQRRHESSWWLPIGTLLVALVALGFAVPWWIENGASVYVSLLASGFSLCL